MVDVEEVSSDEELQHVQPHDGSDAEEQLGSDYEQIEAEDGSDADAPSPASSRPDAEADAGADAVSPSGDFPSGFEQILQLASHIKSSQPEVREKRQRWEKLGWHQKNTVLFQVLDSPARYDLLAELPTAAAAAPEPAHPDAKDAAGIHAAAGASTAAADSSAAATPASSSSSTTSSSGPTTIAAGGFDSAPPDTGTDTGSAAIPSRFESVRYPLALRFKASAGVLFQAGRYAEASLQYQRAIGLFQWARKFQTKEGDEIEWHDLLASQLQQEQQAQPHASDLDAAAASASTAPFHARLPQLTGGQARRARQLVYTCLVNVAACEEKQQHWDQVIAVCEAALSMDMSGSKVGPQRSDVDVAPTDAGAGAASADPPFNLAQLTLKALFRCAIAWQHLDQLEKAVALLQRASKLAPTDAQVRVELSGVRAEVESQRRKDQASFGGLFQRGEIFEEQNVRSSFEPTGAAAASSPSAAGVGGLAAGGASAGSKPSAAAVGQTKEFLSEYLTGVRELARKEREASKHQQQQKRAERRADDDPSDEDVDASIDTSGPSPAAAAASSSASSSSSAASPPSDASLAALYADARSKFGLDLSDPLVQEELRRLQEHHQRTGQFAPPPESDESAASAAAAAAAAERTQSSGCGPPSVRSSGPVKAAVAPTDLSSSGWLGPLLFSLIFAAALRWMRIL